MSSIKVESRPSHQDLLSAGYAFDFDQLTLAPRVVSTLSTRAEADPAVDFGSFRLRIPLLGSPMPDVCGTEMCRALADGGGLGILHRFQAIEQQVAGYRKARADRDRAVGVAGGVG